MKIIKKLEGICKNLYNNNLIVVDIIYNYQTPLILNVNYISLVVIVTLLACVEHKLASSNTLTRNASAASYNAKSAECVNLNSFPAISRTNL